jgi:hypothetical protein
MENQEHLLNNIGPQFVQWCETQGKVTVIDSAVKTAPFKPVAPTETKTEQTETKSE